MHMKEYYCLAVSIHKCGGDSRRDNWVLRSHQLDSEPQRKGSDLPPLPMNILKFVKTIKKKLSKIKFTKGKDLFWFQKTPPMFVLLYYCDETRSCLDFATMILRIIHVSCRFPSNIYF